MSRAALAERKQLERFGNVRSPLEATDPDFAEMRDRLIWGEVAWHGSLDAKMQELISNADRTVLIVSHDMSTLRKLCDSIIWIQDGVFIQQGDPETVLTAYEEKMVGK